jgi:acetylcholinesterase
VQKYISEFGGDPEKVTMCAVLSLVSFRHKRSRARSWGESAGAVSVGLQMVTNGGNAEGLFRGAFMQSGSPPAAGPLEDGQAYFNTFAIAAGCGDSLGAAAVFDCLRGVSTEVIRNATNTTPSDLSFEVRAPLRVRVLVLTART